MLSEKIKIRLFCLLVVLSALFFMVFSQLSFVQKGSLDDLAFLRSTAYLSSKGEGATYFHKILDGSKERLTPETLVRHEIRLRAANYYPLPTLLIGFFEKLNLKYVFASVIIALLSLTMLVVAIFCFLLVRPLKEYAVVILSGLAFSLFPSIAKYPQFFPFQDGGYVWSAGWPRNLSVLTFFIFAVVFFLMPRGNKRIFWIVLLVALIASLNYPFAIIPLILFFLSWLLAKVYPLTKVNFYTFVKVFSFAVAVLFCFKVILIYSFAGFSAILPLLLPMLWIPWWWFSFMFVFWLWKSPRNAPSSGKKEAAEDLVNFLMTVLAVSSCFSIGLGLVGDLESFRFSGNAFFNVFAEFGERVRGIAHLFWWMVLSFLLCLKTGKERILIRLAAIIALFALASWVLSFSFYAKKNHSLIFDQTFSQQSLSGGVSDEAARDEFVFYNSLSNDLKNFKDQKNK